MASLKAEKPAGTQLPPGQAKKEPAAKGGSSTTTKASKQAPTKKATEQKPREPKKKVCIYIMEHVSSLISKLS